MTPDTLPSYFRLALAAAEHSDHHQHMVGAVIMIKNKPVAIGYNQMKTHPKAGVQRIHAELSAIMSVRNKNLLRGSSILIVRKNRSGLIGLARPCTNCQRILAQYGIKEYIYTTNDGYRSEFADLKHKWRNANIAAKNQHSKRAT